MKIIDDHTIELVGEEADAKDFFDHRLDRGDSVTEALNWVCAAFTEVDGDFLQYLFFGNFGGRR